jgi:MFS family permease
MIMFAPAWDWVVAANVLLGVNQGLCWSAAIIMKVDLVGPARRGLAIGLNEATGYLAVSISALASGYLAGTLGLRPFPFLIGIAAAMAGLICSMVVRETHGHAVAEAAMRSGSAAAPSFWNTLGRVSWRDRSLFSVSQAGLMNNLNDGVSWGLFPIYFAAAGASLVETAKLVALYPAVWALAQIGTGPLSDLWGRKWMIVVGMTVQAIALFVIGASHEASAWIGAMIALGLGTALVYPTFLGAVSDHAHPSWRATAIGVYRLWRDLGYAVGALVAGVVADLLGIPVAIQVVAVMTLLSGIVVAAAYREAPKSRNRMSHEP